MALAGYEYSDNNGDGDSDHGHLTAYGTDNFVNAMAPGMDFASFLAYLVQQDADHVVLAGFNHPPRAGHGASRPSLLSPQTRRLVALTETYNHAIYRKRAETHFYAAMIAELDRGWRVAPTCGLDSHGLAEVLAVESGDVKPCRTGILAPSLTPANVVAALLARRTFASRDLNLHLTYTANGSWMGSQLRHPRHVQLDISAEDPNTGRPGDRIRRIEVVGSRGGVLLVSPRFSAHQVHWRPRIPRHHNSYLLVRLYTYDQPTATAIAAPVWFR